MHVMWILFGPQTWGIGGNLLATLVAAFLGATFGVAFRRPIARFWHKHFSKVDELSEIKDYVQKAHQIVSDNFKHLTGEDHPHSPNGNGNGK